MQVTKITIGRLYNLGNYEHIRYELAVEIPAGESPATALIGTEKILKALNPKRPRSIPSDHEIESAERTIKEIKEMTDDEIAARYGRSRALVLHEAEKEFSTAKASLKEWEDYKARARKSLEDLGGAANCVDAK
jgi:hypothetical protein